jgi:phosphoenolpyruvate-protein kinase (PTS system EI component)
MCIALDLINAWAAVHVDGSAESIYHARDERTIKNLRAEMKELQAFYAEDKESWERELRQRAEEAARLAAELAQLEDDLLEGRAAGAKRRIKSKRADL